MECAAPLPTWGGSLGVADMSLKAELLKCQVLWQEWADKAGEELLEHGPQGVRACAIAILEGRDGRERAIDTDDPIGRKVEEAGFALGLQIGLIGRNYLMDVLTNAINGIPPKQAWLRALLIWIVMELKLTK